MAGNLADKIALVTGGGSGIGRASALAFAKEGAKVVVSDVNVGGGEATIQSIQEIGGDAHFIKADVTQATEVKALVDQSVEIYGQLDCAFNNAGVAPNGAYPIADYPEDEWNRLLNINLTGVFLCLKYQLQQMRKQKNGVIVNTASVLGLVATGNGVSSYISGKHGVVGLTKAAALENAKNGIRVNAVCPGYIETPIIQNSLDDPELKASLVKRHPVGRLGMPDEVAEAVIWLCSEAASFVTGHALNIDGGYVIQ